jgi:hypothetical protein
MYGGADRCDSDPLERGENAGGELEYGADRCVVWPARVRGVSRSRW